MSRIHRILAGALALQVILIALVWSSGDDRSLAKLEPIVSLDAGAAVRIEIHDAPGEEKEAGPAIEATRKGDGWVLSSHFDYPAMDIASLLDKLAAMKSRGPMTTSEARHRQLRVADDRYERKLVLHADSGEPLTLYLGTSAGRGKTAVRIGGDAAVHGVAGITANDAGTTVQSWIDTSYLEIDELQTLVVENQTGRFELRKVEGGWARHDGEAEVPVPAGKELDGAAIDRLVTRFSPLRMAAPADPAKKGFEPVATVHVAKADGKSAHEIRIGEEKDDKLLVAADDKVPVWVAKSILSGFIELSEDKLYKDPSEDDAAPPGGPMPGHMPGQPMPMPMPMPR
jgi:hypothetical protein